MSVSDYPEHLNPFYEGNSKLRFWNFSKAKRSGSFSETLRNSRIYQSLRGKKKNKEEKPVSPPELRKTVIKPDVYYRQTLPTTPQSVQTPTRTSVPVPLPRSRFSERVEKTDIRTSAENVEEETLPISSDIPNIKSPFGVNGKVSEPKPKRIRRKKRRAPLPPNKIREEGDDHLSPSSIHNLSKWSLTSVETDISMYSENDYQNLDIVTQEMSEIMNNITKEIEKMTDDTSEHEVNGKTQTDIPDIIASSTEADKTEELLSETNKSSNLSITDENSNIVSRRNSINEEEQTNINKDDFEVADDNKIIYIAAYEQKIDSNENINDDYTEDDNAESKVLPVKCRTEINLILSDISQNELENEGSDIKKDDENCNSVPVLKTRMRTLSKDDLLGNETSVDSEEKT